MRISGTHYRTIWPTAAGAIRVIDQTRLPFEFATIDLQTLDDATQAIRTMVVRGAPLIGATAAYGLALAMRSNTSDRHLEEATRALLVADGWQQYAAPFTANRLDENHSIMSFKKGWQALSVFIGVAPAQLCEVPDLAEYVLSPFDQDEKALAEKTLDRAAEAAEVALRDLPRAMNQFNG